MSGLNINFYKSEVFVFWVAQTEKYDIANKLNCVLGVLPLKYLGIPISDKHLNIEKFNFILDKMRKRLDP